MNLIKVWDSCLKASNQLNISLSSIHNVLSERQKTKTCGGFKWEFINRINKKYIQNG